MTKRHDSSIDPEGLSRPENFVNKKQGMTVVEKVKACGGCFCCLRRDPRSEGWGRARCGKIQPAEFLKEGCTFEPDYDRIYDKGNVE